MRALCTGISGTSKGRFLIAFQSYAALQGKQVEILDMGEEMITQATSLLGDPPRARVERKLLDLPKSTKDQLRADVLEKFLDKAKKLSQNGIDSILATHVSFRWTKTIVPSIDLKRIEEYNPDFYFVLKAEREKIKAVLDAHPAWQFRNVTLDDISVWQDEEMHATKLIARYYLKPYMPFENDPTRSNKDLFDFLYQSVPTQKTVVQRAKGVYETVFVTAMSGVGAKHYLRAFTEYSQSVMKRQIGLLDIGKRIVEAGQSHKSTVTEHNILDEEDSVLDKWRAEAFGKVLVERDRHKDCIVLSHACFRDNGKIRPAFSPELEGEMMRVLNPTVFVTLIDNLLATKIRMFRNFHWQKQNPSLRELALWRDEEIFFTWLLAQYQKRPHYILTVQQPFHALCDIIFKRNVVKGIYLSHPITEILRKDEVERNKYLTEKADLREALRRSYVVYDPFDIRDSELFYALKKDEYTLEEHMADYSQWSQGDTRIPTKPLKVRKEGTEFIVEGSEVKFSELELEELHPYNRDQIVQRDYNLIDQSDAVVVYYPVEDVSAGVLSEITYAYSHGRDVFAWWRTGISPFLERSTTTPPGVFKFEDRDKLLSYMVNEYCRQETSL